VVSKPYGPTMAEDYQIFFKTLLVRNREDSSNKIKFPTFTGKNPNSWLLLANQFFSFYRIPVWDRIPIVGYHMKGEANIWFTNLERFGMIGSWESFVGKLKYHFRKEMQQEKEMQEEEEANQKVQQQILRRRQIDEDLRQAMEKLHECFSKWDKGAAIVHDVAQETAFEIPNSLKSNDQQPVTCKLDNVFEPMQYKDEISGAREIKDFQEPEILQKGRNILSEERRTVERLEVSGEEIQEEKKEQIKNAYVASETHVESVEEEINDEFVDPSPKIEALNFSIEIEAVIFKKPALIFEDAVILVNHQPFHKEEKDSMSFGQVGLGSKSAKGKKGKLGILVHLSLEYTGEDGEGKGFLNLGFEKRLAKRGIGSWIFDPGKKFFSLQVSHRSWNHPGKKSLFFKYGCWIFDPGIERGEREMGKTKYRRLQGSQKIHSDETLPGLRSHEVSSLRLYCLVEINETRTKLKSKIGMVDILYITVGSSVFQTCGCVC
jgi:hypothetical protein